MPYSIGFIDAGFLRAEGARALGQRATEVALDAAACVAVLQALALGQGDPLLRSYWYDGAFAPNHPAYPGQRAYIDAIASTPGIQVRLGHIRETIPT